MIDGGNGLTSCLLLFFAKNKLTMFAGPLPFNPLVHLAESKVTVEAGISGGVVKDWRSIRRNTPGRRRKRNSNDPTQNPQSRNSGRPIMWKTRTAGTGTSDGWILMSGIEPCDVLMKVA
jgi:hypothetical protein